MLTLNDGRSELWQWDTGRTLAVDADCSQVHFSNKVFGRSIDVDVADGVAIIPDILLQTDKELNVWAFVGTAENGYTKISKTFKVIRRNKPADYVFTPHEQITLKDATSILEEAKHVANDAMETAKKAEASADNAAQIADEMKKLAEQVEQNTETATKAKADALNAQTKAEEARNAAEIAKKAAEYAANNAVVDASAASAAATRAQNAANDAAASLASIQVLYQEMQEYVSQSVQDIQTEGNTQVQRVADEGAAQISAAKEQADRAQAEADRAEAARAKAEEVVESCIPDDTAVDGKPWTSKKIVDSLCQHIEESGNPVQVYPVENYPLGVKVSWEPTQDGSGDPSPDNIRPITGMDSVSVTRCGKNLFNPFCFPSYKASNGIEFTRNDDGKVIVSGTATSTAYYNATQLFGLPKGTYTISPMPKSRLTISDENFVYIIGTSVGSGATFTLKRYTILNVFVAVERGITFDNEEIYFQIEIGSTDTPYEPYTGSTTDIALPETVYGGEVDAVSGEGKETWKTINLPKTGWVKDSSTKFTRFNHYNALAAPANNKDQFKNILCNVLPSRETSNDETAIQLESADKRMLRVSVSGIKTLEDFLSFLDAYSVQVCYKLADPIPFTATGTQPIPALSGVNTIYTDADGVVVTGAEDPKHTITELKNAIISLGGNV